MRDTLYKLCGPARLDFFQTWKIRFTQPGRLNDIFEALPSSSIHPKTFQQFGPEERSRAKAAHSQMLELAIQERDDYFGILSLTDRPESLVMWSHYADSHRGFALGFDPLHPFFQNLETGLGGVKKVRYSEKRPRIKPFASSDDPDHDPVFYTKNKEWAYESEWRLLKWLAAADDWRVNPNSCEIVHLYNVPVEAVTEVIIGAKADVRMDNVIGHLRSRKRATFRMRRARLSETNFELDFEDLNPMQVFGLPLTE
jgi:hypothetical protein